ncbi:thyroid hormone receptor beta-A-like [Tubulanus polymorphus]|uniref:thyroid hormone receptor beta-A-like n=1 Tax=Tubulanus polymorphus TaxID=672921 RepID=UPI003DA3C8E5
MSKNNDETGKNANTPKKSLKAPYIPSYMDLTNGPEPCAVCADAATGYHYRCMTCEGCKGFFRRTIQKNLQYNCKWNGNCYIDKNSRNQCQQCRFIKCLKAGMATDLVLNEKQRVAKRKLIEDNRERRKTESTTAKMSKHSHNEGCTHDSLSLEDIQIVNDIVNAYASTSRIDECTNVSPSLPPYIEKHGHNDHINNEAWVQLAKIMTPSIVKVVEFAKLVPGFIDLIVEDQIMLLKSCCLEIMCLRVACRYDSEHQALVMHNGILLTRNQVSVGGLGYLIEPIFDFAVGLSKLKLDHKEISLLAAVLLMQSDRSGLRDSESVEKLQDAILGAFKRYIATHRPQQPVHWAKILMKVTDLRTISTRHAERMLCTKLDSTVEIPPMFLEMFIDGKRPDDDSLGSSGVSSRSPSVKSDSTGDDLSNSSACSSPGSFQFMS